MKYFQDKNINVLQLVYQSWDLIVWKKLMENAENLSDGKKIF